MHFALLLAVVPDYGAVSFRCQEVFSAVEHKQGNIFGRV